MDIMKTSLSTSEDITPSSILAGPLDTAHDTYSHADGGNQEEASTNDNVLNLQDDSASKSIAAEAVSPPRVVSLPSNVIAKDEDYVERAAPRRRRTSLSSSVDSDPDDNGMHHDDWLRSESSYSGESKKDSIWTRLAKRGDVWEDEDDDDDKGYSCKNVCKDLIVEESVSIKAKWVILKAHPHIGIIGVVCFLVFCAASLAITFTFSHHYEDDKVNEALGMAEDLGLRFQDALDGVTLPLFSIAEFVKELPYFVDLPIEIGPGGQEGSAPYIEDIPITHRDVSGICDNSTTVDHFNRLARNIKESARLSKILLQLQLAPQAVQCLMYPLNNTEDFDAPIFLDSSAQVGLDWLVDPDSYVIAEKALISNETMHIVGPFAVPVKACDDSSDVCQVAVQNAFMARLPIKMPNYNITVNGTAYPVWGFATELINGDELIEKAFLDFNPRGTDFRLIKYENGKVSVFKASRNVDKVEVTDLEQYTVKTLNGNWVVQVGYVGGSKPSWLGGAIVASFLLSFVLAWMLMIIFFEKQAHQDLLSEMLPKKALQKIQRGETVVEKYSMVTVFFCDIVGYTSISADMRPIQIMKMLNTYYSEVDKLANKHKVFKIETIGDSYMCVGGCPDRSLGPEAAEHVAVFALELIELVKNFSMEDGSQILIRCGINSGPVVAGVVGTNRPQYTIFGDAVNAAARMETTSEKMKIQCSEMSYRLLRDAPNYEFNLIDRGGIEIKGKGRYVRTSGNDTSQIF